MKFSVLYLRHHSYWFNGATSHCIRISFAGLPHDSYALLHNPILKPQFKHLKKMLLREQL